MWWTRIMFKAMDFSGVFQHKALQEVWVKNQYFKITLSWNGSLNVFAKRKQIYHPMLKRLWLSFTNSVSFWSNSLGFFPQNEGMNIELNIHISWSPLTHVTDNWFKLLVHRKVNYTFEFHLFLYVFSYQRKFRRKRSITDYRILRSNEAANDFTLLLFYLDAWLKIRLYFHQEIFFSSICQEICAIGFGAKIRSMMFLKAEQTTFDENSKSARLDIFTDKSKFR